MLDSPRLWTSLRLPDIPETRICADLFLIELKNWLSRSHELPLSFGVNIGMPSAEDAMYVGLYLLLLFEHAPRWLKISMHLGFSELFDVPIFPAMSASTNSTPLLKKLTLYASGYLPESQPIMTHFRNSPSLRCVNLRHSMITEWALPWAQLKTLHLERAAPAVSQEDDFDEAPQFDPKVLLDMLKQCINLEELRLCMLSVQGLDDPVDPVIIPALLRLDAEFIEPDGTFFHTFFSTVRAPKLASLKIDSQYLLDDPNSTPDSRFWRRTPVDLRSAFLAFLSHCAGSMRELTLKTGVEKDTFISIISTTPNLTSLHVFDTFHISYFEALTLQFSANGQDVVSGRCPHLSSIDVTVDIPHRERSHPVYKNTVYSSVVDMIESRWRTPAGVLSGRRAERLVSIGLHKMLLRKMEMESPGLWTRLQAMGDEGLVVKSRP